jgi:hypothetical protein
VPGSVRGFRLACTGWGRHDHLIDPGHLPGGDEIHEGICQAPPISKDPQGTEGMITKIHTGLLGGNTHLDVRLPKGEFVPEVPIDYFLT